MSTTTKITYKNKERGDEEFYMFTIPGMVKEWRKDHTIPLTSVVETFDVFQSETGGNTGRATRPSKGVLRNFFETTNEDSICRFIIEHGEVKGEVQGMKEDVEFKNSVSMGQYGSSFPNFASYGDGGRRG
ncbi:hypothetical protein IWQ62_004047 [Dispira parvispora]|uniref:Ribosome maturation protein SDO1/SBDS N-terminal domain-containing protein n=1 Tax=Dispira parvispora TaxID=1520584 RepID=A0A9W8E5Z7_9FUNG|nr:hypothetical protein IWQ62_004047 [Dispira parvispora]